MVESAHLKTQKDGLFGQIRFAFWDTNITWIVGLDFATSCAWNYDYHKRFAINQIV